MSTDRALAGMNFITSAAVNEPAADQLVLAPIRFHPGVDRSDPTIRVVSEPAVFRHLLSRSRPVLVVIFAPPATRQDIQAVVRERRRRTDMRAVLVDEPGFVGERLAALRSGFDEAIGADIDGRELLGRIALLAQKARAMKGSRPIELGDGVVLHPEARELRIGDRRVHLRPRECGLLEVLALHRGRTLSRRQLLEALGAESTVNAARTIDVHIRWLREKLGPLGSTTAQLVTVRGIGYRLDPALASALPLLTRR